jgi:hypothetical protein
VCVCACVCNGVVGKGGEQLVENGSERDGSWPATDSATKVRVKLKEGSTNCIGGVGARGTRRDPSTPHRNTQLQ